jgi:hypothetical protein
MPDRHFELPAHPDLEYYRKQAKHLRSYEAGDKAARDRAAEVLGDRAAERFLLSDAQFVLAQERGFRTWAEFRADIESQRTTGDRPVSRLWGRGSADYASQADSLLTKLRRGDPGALRRLRAYVPRCAAATDAATAELRDARLIVARELGFPTWRELVAGAEKSQRDAAERPAPVPTPAPGQTASRRWRPPSTLAARRWSTCSPSTASSRGRSGPMPRAAGWILSGPVSMRMAGCGPTPRCRAPTSPTSSRSQPGTRRPTIRSRSWPRPSSTPASTAGPRSCAGSSTAA